MRLPTFYEQNLIPNWGKDYVNLVAELNNGKYFSGGLVFKVHLK